MKELRRLIRRIILEGKVKEEFDNIWYNEVYDAKRDSLRTARRMSSDTAIGTFPRDALDHGYQYRMDYTDEDIDQLFDNKRDLKRRWNQMIDKHSLRSFWEGPKMKYFHSLSYYGGVTDTLQQGEYADGDIKNLSITAFLRDYKLEGNKDEMSTWGYYVPGKMIACGRNNMTIGVLLKGRVTLATKEDAWTESRSKASKIDKQRHQGSGMPKRPMPVTSAVNNLLFEEEDIKENRMIGECVLDNWGIEAIVYNHKHFNADTLEPVVKKLSEEYGIPYMTAEEAFGKKL